MKIILNSEEVDNFLRSVAEFYKIDNAVTTIKDLANEIKERELELFAKVNRIEREFELLGKKSGTKKD